MKGEEVKSSDEERNKLKVKVKRSTRQKRKAKRDIAGKQKRVRGKV